MGWPLAPALQLTPEEFALCLPRRFLPWGRRNPCDTVLKLFDKRAGRALSPSDTSGRSRSKVGRNTDFQVRNTSSMASRRYTILIADKTTGVVRRLTVSL